VENHEHPSNNMRPMEKHRVPASAPRSRNPKRKARDNTQNKEKQPKSTKYSVPEGSTIDEAGNLVPPRPQSSARMSTASSQSSLAGSLLDLNTASETAKKTKSPLTASKHQPADGKPKKVKPITADANYKVTKQLLDNLTLSSKPFIKILSSRDEKAQTRIECASIDDKIVVIEDLKRLKIAFHTHPEAGTRTKLFVLKKFVRYELNELKKITDEVNIATTKITFLVDHPERPVYLLHSDDENISLNFLQHKHRAIDSIIVSWDRYDLRRKRPMPCRRCKMWGHTASSCGRLYRCIKCTATHEPGQCERKDRNVGSPKCVNCDGDHAANSTQCPAYLSYAKNIQKRRQSQQKPVSLSTTVRWPSASATAFVSSKAPKKSALSYSDIVSGSQNASGSENVTFQTSQAPNLSYADTLKDFSTIPNIGRTMKLFAEMTAKLRATDFDHERLTILAQYCSPQNAA
jgi:hypothetical protein